jgi:VIT1/CCC1 family predicted Fe2+/Mn2+ transporter
MKLIIQLTKAVIHDQHARRTMMFVVLCMALVALFAWTTFLSGWLSENPFMFLGYWASCTWLTFAAVLLAIFDMVAMRAQLRREKRRLKEEIFGRSGEK